MHLIRSVSLCSLAAALAGVAPSISQATTLCAEPPVLTCQVSHYTGDCEPDLVPSGAAIVIGCNETVCICATATHPCGGVTLTNDLTPPLVVSFPGPSTGTVTQACFTHTFTTAGTHVVTWTATYGAYTATCELTIIVECGCRGPDVCGKPKSALPDLTASCLRNDLYSTFGDQVAFATCANIMPYDSYVLGALDLQEKASATPGAPWLCADGAATYHHPDWTESKLGDIFGLTIDDLGNIYVAATTVYRCPRMVGSVGGGAGAIYRIDGSTGVPSLFADLPNTPTAGPGTGPSLGNLDFAAKFQHFYVSNMDDGLIYRLDTSGAVIETWDHGLERPTYDAALTAIPDATVTADEYTPLGRRVWGVKVFHDRLYYAVWWEDFNQDSATEANEIWSVALDAGGGFIIGSNRREIILPALGVGYGGNDQSSPVSDIAFSPTGTMLLAERTRLGNCGDTQSAHQSRALEYVCQPGPTLSGPGEWVAAPYTYAAGAGGNDCAGGCDYDFATGGCAWISADAMAGAYGLQGFTPYTSGALPSSIVFDLDGVFGPLTKNRIGDVEITCGDCAPDIAAPVVSCTPTFTVCAGAGVTFSATAVDNCGPLELEENLTHSSAASATETVSHSVPQTLSSPGLYAMLWTATDGAGNVGTCVTTYRVIQCLPCIHFEEAVVLKMCSAGAAGDVPTSDEELQLRVEDQIHIEFQSDSAQEGNLRCKTTILYDLLRVPLQP